MHLLFFIPNDKHRTFQLAKKLSEAVWVNDLNIDDETEIFKIVKEIVDIKKLKDFILIKGRVNSSKKYFRCI